MVKRDEIRTDEDHAMVGDEHESELANRSRDSSNDEAEIDVVDNVSNSNCDEIRHNNATTSVATDLRKYEWGGIICWMYNSD